LQLKQIDRLLRHPARGKFRALRPWREKQFLEEPGATMGVMSDQKVLQHRGILEQLDVLEGSRNPEPGDPMRRRTTKVDVSEQHIAAGRLVDPTDEVEDRRFSRAIWTNQREDLAAPHVEAHPIDRAHATEANRQISNGEDCLGQTHSPYLNRSDFWYAF
jgi:hypothetical protein